MRMLLTVAIAGLLSTGGIAGEDLPLNAVDASRESRPLQVQFDEAPSLERALDPYSGRPVLKPLTQGAYGFRVKLGGMLPTSGFAFGPEFIKRNEASAAMFRASARRSVRGYYLLDGEVALPRLADGLGFLNALAVHRSLPELPYYGQGPASRNTARTSFHLKDTNYELTAGVRPVRHVRVGATGGYLQATAGPGRNPSDSVPGFVLIPPAQLDRTDFATAGGFAHFDYTDVPGSPRSGGDYSIRFVDYHDLTAGLASHRRFDLRAQHYLPFFSRQRTIALRGYAVLTGVAAGRAIPFYLQPSLGGPDTLRGFEPFRFSDNNMVLFNAEYRWKISSGAEMAVFADRGRVFSRVSRFDWRGMESSYGLGMRLNARQNVFLRLDFGCSREGCQLWLRFNNVY